MIALAAIALAQKPMFTVDYTALTPNVGGWAVQRTGGSCDLEGTAVVDGLPAAGRAMAVEIYSRKGGYSSWGHASLRFLYCRDGALHDVEYEVYEFDRQSGVLLRDYWPDDPVLDDRSYLRGQLGRRILYRNDDPVDTGDFASSAAYNREIYELWLDTPPAEIDAILTSLDASWTGERAGMDARTPLPDRYHALGANCTAPLQQWVTGVRPSAFPEAWLRRPIASDRVVGRVLYPSHHAVRVLLRRNPAGVEQSARLHPIFRWNRRLPTVPPDLLAARPAAIALLDPSAAPEPATVSRTGTACDGP